MVTLLNIAVFGLAGRLGATTASSDVKPSLLFDKLLQNAVSAASTLITTNYAIIQDDQ